MWRRSTRFYGFAFCSDGRASRTTTFLALAARAGEDDKGSREILAKAIKAHGGEKNLKKTTAAHIKSTGTLD